MFTLVHIYITLWGVYRISGGLIRTSTWGTLPTLHSTGEICAEWPHSERLSRHAACVFEKSDRGNAMDSDQQYITSQLIHRMCCAQVFSIYWVCPFLPGTVSKQEHHYV